MRLPKMMKCALVLSLAWAEDCAALVESLSLCTLTYTIARACSKSKSMFIEPGNQRPLENEHVRSRW